MKDLLVYLPPLNQPQHITEYAISLAARTSAHLEGLTFSFLPDLAGYYATLPDEFFARMLRESEIQAENAWEAFVEHAKLAKIQYTARSHLATPAEAERIFGRLARCFDMAIVPQTDAVDPPFFNPSFEHAIFDSGRPTLFVPSIHRGPASLDNILVCWNGERWAARAVADALPLMKFAKQVHVLQIELGDAGAPECPAEEIARHLLRHGVTTELHTFTREDPDIAAAILSFAADCEARLIVMGGYGHSRTREVLFGGATRGVLESMTVPVLMSH